MDQMTDTLNTGKTIADFYDTLAADYDAMTGFEQRFAADLDHARASWQIAEIYNREGRMADAARYEKKAADLGYQIPPRLPNRGY